MANKNYVLLNNAGVTGDLKPAALPITVSAWIKSASRDVSVIFIPTSGIIRCFPGMMCVWKAGGTCNAILAPALLADREQKPAARSCR